MQIVSYYYEEIKKTWEQYIKEATAYAVDEIKKRFLHVAWRIQEEGFKPVLIRNGEESRPLRKFSDIMLWWRPLLMMDITCFNSFHKTEAATKTLSCLQHGTWKKYWAKDLEVNFMETA